MTARPPDTARRIDGGAAAGAQRGGAGRPARAWRAHPTWYAVLVAALLASVPLVAVHRVPLTAELVLLMLLTAFTAVSRRAAAAWAWTLWLAGIVLLDDLRGLQAVVGQPHGADVIRFERSLLGVDPVVALQAHWGRPPGLTGWDWGLSLVYLLHSPAPLVAGLALWRWRRALFRPYVASILLVAAAGLATYLAFPEMPPWLASQHGLLPPVRRITTLVMEHAGPLSSVYGGADPLPNAAMPSLHVAYPLIVATWLVVGFGRRMLWVLAYPCAVAVGVVYLGEHYAVDVVAGVAVAALGMLVAARLWSPRPAPTRVSLDSG